MIEYKGVTKVYGSDVVAVDDVDLEIGDGEFVLSEVLEAVKRLRFV